MGTGNDSEGWDEGLKGLSLPGEMLLVGQRVIPKRLLELRFDFEDMELEPTRQKLLGEPLREKYLLTCLKLEGSE